MKKIPTLFRRDPADMRHLLDEIHPECTWVVDGKGRATRKRDGTCVMLDDEGHWWSRREVKEGKVFPGEFRLVDFDPVTGKHTGWEPIEQSSFHKHFRAALNNTPPLDGRPGPAYPPGTYELCGPKINGDPEGFGHHALVWHGDASAPFIDALVVAAREGRQRHQPLLRQSLGVMLSDLSRDGWEGIVWHHPDGRMAKIKARDYR